MRNRFHEKIVLVTGAAGNLGRAYSAAFAAEGAAVGLIDIDGEAAEAVAAKIAATGARAVGFGGDITDDSAMEALIGNCIETLGGVDILVNNAAIFDNLASYVGEGLRAPSLGTRVSTDHWRRVFEVNVFAAVTLARLCRPSMIERGGGVIVNQCSSSAWSTVGAYGVSKLAQRGVTLCLAQELAADNIRVVGIAPGLIGASQMTEELMAQKPGYKEMSHFVLDNQLIKRFANVEDLLPMVLLLSSDDGSFITGQTILVDGGFVKNIG